MADVRQAERRSTSRSASSKIGTLSGRTFDAVVAGQAWHWVDPVLGARKAAQVLRPNGLLALYWHVFDPPSEVGTAFDGVMQRVAPDAPLQNPGLQLQEANLKQGLWTALELAEGFARTRALARYKWQREYTRDEWLDHLLTTGTLTLLAPDQLATVREAVGSGIDSMGGGFTMDYVTLASLLRTTARVQLADGPSRETRR